MAKNKKQSITSNALNLAIKAFEAIKSGARSYGLLPFLSPLPQEPDVRVIFYPKPTKSPPINIPTPTPSPSPTPTMAPSGTHGMPIPTPLPSRYNQEDIANAIRAGFRKWAYDPNNPDRPDVPAVQYTNVFAKIPFEYPEVFGRYPFFFPAQAIVESSAGQKPGAPNNFINWAYKKQLERGPEHKPSFPQILEEAASGIAQKSPYYQNFRKSLDIADLIKVYAPPSENKTDKYIQDINNLMKIFEKELK